MVENPEKFVILTIFGEVAISTNYDSHDTLFYTSQLLLSSKPKHPPEFLTLKHSSLRTSNFHNPNRITDIIIFIVTPCIL